MKMIEAKNEESAFSDLLADMQGETEETQNGYNEGFFDAEIIEEPEEMPGFDSEGEPETDHEPEPDAFNITDKELAEIFAMLIDVIFSMTWGIISNEHSSEYRLDRKAKADLAKAFIPLMTGMRKKLAPEWLLLVTILALQMPNGIKAFEKREENTKKKKRKENQKKYENADPVDVEILETEPPEMKRGEDGIRQPTKKKCGLCGKYGHNRAGCPQNPKNMQDEEK